MTARGEEEEGCRTRPGIQTGAEGLGQEAGQEGRGGYLALGFHLSAERQIGLSSHCSRVSVAVSPPPADPPPCPRHLVLLCFGAEGLGSRWRRKLVEDAAMGAHRG